MTTIKVNGLNLTSQINAASDAADGAENAKLQAQTARTGAEAARDAARTARDEAEALVLSDLGTTDGQTRALIEDDASQTAGALDERTAASIDLRAPAAAPLNGYRTIVVGDSLTRSGDSESTPTSSTTTPHWSSP